MGKRRLTIFMFLAAGILGGTLRAPAQDSLRVTSDSLSAGGDTTIPKGSADTVARKTPDTTARKGLIDTALVAMPSLDSLRHLHSARRAGLYSAVLPGLGQIYNHQYIKVPLMWGGLGVAAGIFLFDFHKYITYRDAYRLRLNGRLTHDPKVDVYSLDDLQYLRDGYRQYVDYSVLGFAAAYLYNILDAIVFAHLYHFDISNDLSRLRFGPVFPSTGGPYTAGIGFTYTF